MRLGRREGAGRRVRGATYWADRLAGVGASLDTAGAPLSGLAISITGERTLLSVLGLGLSMYHGLRSPVDLVYQATQPAPPSCEAPGNWERRLGAVGQLLDAERGISDPCVVDLDDRFLITALAGTDDARQLTTWSLVKEATVR